MRKSIKKAFASVIACTMAFAFAATAVPFSAMAGNVCNKDSLKAGKAKIDLDKGEYHAYLMIQAKNSWVFRDGFWNSETGTVSKMWNGMQQSGDGGYTQVDGTVTDAEIKGNGTYTVKVEGLNDCMSKAPAGADPVEFSILGFSTDIPYNKDTKDVIKFSDIKVSIDGGSEQTADTVQLDDDAIAAPKTFQVDCLNTYHDDYANMSLQLPKDSCSVTFTVSGFNYDNPDAKGDTATSSSATSATSSTSSATATADKGGMSTGAVVAIVVVAVVVIAGVVVVVKKKKH